MANLKNTPSQWVVMLIATLILMIIIYLLLTLFLPYLFQDLTTGEASPAKK